MGQLSMLADTPSLEVRQSWLPNPLYLVGSYLISLDLIFFTCKFGTLWPTYGVVLRVKWKNVGRYMVGAQYIGAIPTLSVSEGWAGRGKEESNYTHSLCALALLSLLRLLCVKR